MASEPEFLPGGTITSAKGFVAGATFAGMKTYAEDKLDLGLLRSEGPCITVGVFTTSSVKSASLRLTQRQLAKGRVRALVVNSGIANTSVGEQGLKDAQETIELAARQTQLEPEEVAICSTGLIGVEMPMALLRASMGKIGLSADGGNLLARAIMTTDSHPKEAALSYEQDGKTVTLGGIVKGSGMIHPEMATLLGFIATDAAVERGFLQKALKEAVDSSFNMVSVDADTSTNDTVLLFANGASGIEEIAEGSAQARAFQDALTQLCAYLAREVARDGEGATKLLEVRVEGARTVAEARKAAKSVVSSNLVKTAVHGGDPNWGRVMAALGKSGAQVDEGRLALYLNEVCILEGGRPIPFHKDAVVVIMRGGEVTFRIALNLGKGTATAWGCDLTEEYVTFNSGYTT
ncbi:MAG: bifunctional glutamate N-acetyltransferase/amino-acid acetyltransferase ArgJ [Dehalococcoidia bacterium]